MTADSCLGLHLAIKMLTSLLFLEKKQLLEYLNLVLVLT